MTAAQCLKHKWLQRRPKSPPKVAPKPLNIPAAQLKASTPSPIPPNIDNDESSGSLTHDDEEEDENESLAGVSIKIKPKKIKKK